MHHFLFSSRASWASFLIPFPDIKIHDRLPHIKHFFDHVYGRAGGKCGLKLVVILCRDVVADLTVGWKPRLAFAATRQQLLLKLRREKKNRKKTEKREKGE